METEGRLAEVEALIVPLLDSHGLTLVDLEWRREGRRWVLRFFVDKMQRGGQPGTRAGGTGERVSIADCQRFSQEMGDLLDASGLISESYDLEVSSPGLDRVLRKEREFRWAMGKAIQCWVAKSVGGRTVFTGHLRGITDEALSLEEPDGQLRALPRGLVTKARLAIELPLRCWK